MHFLNDDESVDWLRGRTVGGDGMRHQARVSFECSHPQTSYAVAATLVALLAPWQEALLRVEQWGIWASSENMHLYSALRRASGDTRSLADAPGHLFSMSECEAATDFLQLVIENGWDASVTTSDDSVGLRACHDGRVTLSGVDLARIEGARRDLSRIEGIRVELNSP